MAVLTNDDYPGYPLSIGSTGTDVAKMQRYLNAIKAGLYPSLTELTVDGIFGSKTAATVKQYQTIKGLKVDGIIGPATWNAIVLDYNSITPAPRVNNDYPGYPLQSGSSGLNVAKMQTYLNLLSDTTYPTLTKLTVDAKYGSKTTATVKQYQTLTALAADGVIGKQTWYGIVMDINALDPDPDYTYPGYPLATGSKGENVAKVQSYLNAIKAAIYGALTALTVDGEYGPKTTSTVKQY